SQNELSAPTAGRDGISNVRFSLPVLRNAAHPHSSPLVSSLSPSTQAAYPTWRIDAKRLAVAEGLAGNSAPSSATMLPSAADTAMKCVPINSKYPLRVRVRQ